MSTSSRGNASDSPAQAAIRKVCQTEDGQMADRLREEQSAVNQDLSNRLEAVEKKEDRVSELDASFEALGERITTVEDLGPRLDSALKLTEDLGQRLDALEQGKEASQASLARIESVLAKAPAQPGPAPAPIGDPIMDDTVRQLRAQVNGLLEREGVTRRHSTRGLKDHVHFTEEVKKGAVSAPAAEQEPAQAVVPTPASAAASSSARSPAKSKSTHVKDEVNTSDEEAQLDNLEGFESTDNEDTALGKPKSFWDREIGPKFESLSSIKPADPRFDRLLSYRFYRLANRTQTRNSKGTQQLRGFIRQMNTTLGEDKFSGADPILVFDFLIRIFEEADNLGMSESQALAVLPYYLSGNARALYKTARRGKTGQGVHSWCEAVQWLLRTYANSAAIRDAVQEFRSTKQKVDETEVPYGNRVSIAAYRCGNVFTDSELMNVFVDGLLPVTRTLVARFRESAGRSTTFEQLVAFARDEGDAYRARLPSRSRPPKGTLPSSAIAVNMVDDNSTVPASHEGDPEMFGLLPDWSATPASTEAPSTVDDATDAILYGERRVNAPRLPYSGPATQRGRPGWQDRPLTPRERLTRIICFVCYGVGHLASECSCPLRDVARVKRNFEALTREEKSIVPRQAYERALAYLQALPLPGQSEPQAQVVPSQGHAEEVRASDTVPVATTEPANPKN